MSESRSEEALKEAYVAGDRRAFDELRRMYRLPPTAGEEELERVEDTRVDPRSASAPEGGTRDRVLAALEQLPESQRIIVHLHKFEDLTFPEIARALGTTEGAVKLRAFRAYEKLRVSLADLSSKKGDAA